jgi:gluconolactonase
MKNLTYLLIVFILFSCVNKSEKQKSQKNEAISKTTNTYKVEKLAGDFKFTEGPAVDAEGNVYFTDLRQHMILVWTTDEQLDTIRVNSGRANGLYFDKNGNLLVCEGDKGQITSISPRDEYKVITATYEGVRFNQPNDLWLDPQGGVYFTDPRYGADDKELNQDGMHVYYISPDHSSVIRVCDDFEKPNGVLGTPDGKTLYVTDAQANKTYKYAIQKDGSLINKTLFVDLGCDGMTIDVSGNVYLTTNGKKAVDIFSPSGELLESIPVPEKPSNLCFGGKDRNQLYITARTSIYRVKLDAKGVD